MFQLKDKEVTMTYTPRVEKHGDANEPGCTLNIKLTGHNILLSMLDERLPSMFFIAPPVEEQDLVDQVAEEGGNLTRLRFPMLGKKFSWSYETSGYRVVIGGGFDNDGDLIFVQSDLKKFSFEIEEGGTISVNFNINCHPNTEEAGRLYDLNGSNVDLTLEPPSINDRAIEDTLDETLEDETA